MGTDKTSAPSDQIAQETSSERLGIIVMIVGNAFGNGPLNACSCKARGTGFQCWITGSDCRTGGTRILPVNTGNSRELHTQKLILNIWRKSKLDQAVAMSVWLK
jgi:hypothetical protein